MSMVFPELNFPGKSTSPEINLTCGQLHHRHLKDAELPTPTARDDSETRRNFLDTGEKAETIRVRGRQQRQVVPFRMVRPVTLHVSTPWESGLRLWWV